MTTGLLFTVGGKWCRFCGDAIGTAKWDHIELTCHACVKGIKRKFTIITTTA